MPPANSKTAPLSPAKGNPSSTALAELRAALPISLSALARRCGYSKASLSLLFAKGQLPSTPHIRAALLAAVARELKALNLNPAPILHLSKTQTETPTMDPFTLNFFSLLNNPFSPARVNAPADVLQTAEHNLAVQRIMEAGVHQEFLILVGRHGSGKTTAVDAAAAKLESAGACAVVRILQPETEKLKIAGILKAICRHIGSAYRGYDQSLMMESIREILTGPGGRRLLFIIDDGHALHPQTLYAVKRSWDNLKLGHRHLVGIVILAQEYIHHLLNLDRLMEVRDHADLAEIVGFLNPAEVADYIQLKFKSVKIQGAKIFTPDACKQIWKRESARPEFGSHRALEPRRLNKICERALMETARLGGDPVVTPDLIDRIYTATGDAL